MTIAYAEAAPNRATPGTGAAFYAPAVLDAAECEANRRRTHIVSDAIDPVLREVLETFQSNLVHQLAGMAARVSLWSSQGQAASPITLGALTAWSGQAGSQHWLPHGYISALSDVTLTATGTSVGRITANVTGSNSEDLSVIANGTITVSQIAGAAAASFSAFNVTPALSWVQSVTTNYDPLFEKAGSRSVTVPLAVRAVEDIADWFGVPAADIFKSTGIAKRTYQEWKRTGTRRPRSSSEGRLWELHQLATDLVETMGLLGVRRWMNENPSRRKLLRSGVLDKLASQAYASAATTDRRPPWVGAGSPEIHAAPRRKLTLSQMEISDVVEPG